jgi:nucleotide-binding universal stress UspA family protein
MMEDAFPARILLATDGSKDAEHAARAAVDLSKSTGAELHVCHVWRPLPHYAYPSLVPEKYHPPYEEGARKLLDEQVGRMGRAGGAVAEAHLLMARPAEAIIDLGEEIEAALIVVGSRGLGSVRRLVVGSVAEGVVHLARCPVLVVRGGKEAWPPRSILIGDDGSGPAKGAGELAAAIAKMVGAGTILVRAYENPPEPVGGWSAQDRIELDESLSREREALEERAEELATIAGSRPETRLIETEPTLAMLIVAEEEGEESTLVAVGSRGLGAAKRAMLGSVSTKILRVARGPVLVCPHATSGDAQG